MNWKKPFFFIMLTTMFVFFSCGCTEELDKIQAYAEQADIYNAIALVESELAKTQNSFTSQLETPAVQDELTRAFYDDIKLNITPPASEESSTTVEVTIPDLAAIYRANRDVIQTIDSLDALKDLLRAHLGEYATTTTITEAVYKEGAVWKLCSTEQVDALIGASVDEMLSAASDEIGVTVEITENETVRLISAVEAMEDTYEKAD